MHSSVYRFFYVGVILLGTTTAVSEITSERSIGEARISHIAQLPATDLVIINNGFDGGLRQGMVCSVTRAGENIGQLLLVDLRPQNASALILDLTPGSTLQIGDTVAVKTVSARK